MKRIIFINAIIWAALIIVNAILFKGHENSNTMFILLIGGFTIVNSLLINNGKVKYKRCSKAVSGDDKVHSVKS